MQLAGETSLPVHGISPRFCKNRTISHLSIPPASPCSVLGSNLLWGGQNVVEDQKGAELLLQGLQGMCLTLQLVFPMDLRKGVGQQGLEDVSNSAKEIICLH